MLLIAGAGPERAPEITVDAYVALTMDWPRRAPATALWWRFVGERTMLETAFDPESAELVHVALVLTGPVARVDSPPPAPVVVSPGIPRCDPAEWARRARRGEVREFADHYVADADPMRTQLGADHLLVRIGDGDEPAMRELSCGRVRFGLSAGDALLWICVGGFSADERARLEEHAAHSLLPPSVVPPSPAPARPPQGRPWWLGGARGA